MSRADDPLDALLESVSRGVRVDWNAASARAGGDLERSQVRALAEVARIAEFNRSLQRGRGTPDSPLPPPGGEPRRFGALLLLERVGSGTSGEVHRAWDPVLEREVALKVLRPDGSAGAAALVEEARALARLRHPEVVSVHGIAEQDGQLGMWMEFLRGEDLAQRIERLGPLPAAEAVRIGTAAARALSAVHAAGLVHRDLKPANLVITEDGRVVLTDFGLGQRRLGADDDPLRISGTPMFMPPERLAGGPASARSDLYALGVTLWFALAGRPPFAARTLAELREQAGKGAWRSLAEERPDLPPPLVAVIERSIAPEPGERFTHAAEMGDALSASLEPLPVTPSAGRMLLTVAAAAAIVAAAWMLLPARRADPPASPPEAASPPAAAATFDLEASLMRRADGTSTALTDGDRVRPGDRLSLRFRASRRAHVYVLNEDERGESYLLFPQPLFDLRNPLPADSTLLLPGEMAGQPSAWTVTSRGGREHFLVVASLEPVAELEAELSRLPAPEPGREPRYAAIPAASIERLRGVGGVGPLSSEPSPSRAGVLERFQGLAGLERGVRGIWVRRVTLENPSR